MSHVAERKVTEYLTKSGEKGFIILRVTVPGSEQRYHCIYDPDKGMDRPSCVEYESNEEYQEYHKLAAIILARLAEYRKIVGFALPETVDELISDDFSVDELRREHSVLYSSIIDDIEKHRDILYVTAARFALVAELPGVEVRFLGTKEQEQQFAKTYDRTMKVGGEILARIAREDEELERQKDMITERLAELEDRYDIDDLPDVDTLMEELPKYRRRFPILAEVSDEIEKLADLVKQRKENEELGERRLQGKLDASVTDYYSSDIHKLKKQVWEEIKALDENDWSANRVHKLMGIRQKIFDQKISEELEIELLDIVDKQFDKVNDRQMLYFYMFRGGGYTKEVREAANRNAGALAERAILSNGIGGRSTLKVVEPKTKETFICYLGTTKTSQGYCIEYDLTQEYADYKKIAVE